MEQQKIIAIIDENLLKDCKDHYSKWETTVKSEGNFYIENTLSISSELPSTEIRSLIIRTIRQMKRQNVDIKGIQIFGKNIQPFYFYLKHNDINYVFQTDVCYGNWPDVNKKNTTWEDLNLDRWLTIDEFPSDYQQNAWVARWSGINIKNENEAELLNRFINRRSNKNYHDYDAAIVCRDADLGYTIHKNSHKNIKDAFPIVREFHGSSSMEILLKNPGVLINQNLRYLILFGHGGPEWNSDIYSKDIYSVLKQNKGADVIALNGCCCGLWRSQIDLSIRNSNLAFNFLNPAQGGAMVVMAYSNSPQFLIEADYSGMNTLSQNISDYRTVGDGWLNWINKMVPHLQKVEKNDRMAIEALTYEIYGDGTWAIW